jgi:hypothetical protein
MMKNAVHIINIITWALGLAMLIAQLSDPLVYLLWAFPAGSAAGIALVALRS